MEYPFQGVVDGQADSTRHRLSENSLLGETSSDGSRRPTQETVSEKDVRATDLEVGGDGSGASTGETTGAEDVADPFGSAENAQVNHVGILLVAETVSLGILSLPSAMAAVGFVPGVLLIAGMGAMATYTGYVIFQVRMRYPQVHSFSDVAQLMFGRVGREIIEVAQVLVFVFIMAAHILTFSYMMNTLSRHATCTIVFSVVGTILSFMLTLPRKLQDISYISVFSCLSIVTAVVVAMVAMGISKPGVGDNFPVVPYNLTSFPKAVLAVSNITIAYAGHVAFFGFISELQQPRDFPKALAQLQITAITLYVVVAVVIYYFAGQKVASPALGSASPIVRKIAYGIATPTIVVAGVINASVAAKNIYVRFWRGLGKKEVMSEKSFRARASYWVICASLWIVAFIIAEAVPVFNNLLGLIGALLCSWFCYGFNAMFWLWMNRNGYTKSWKKIVLTCLNVGIFCFAVSICGLGLYATSKAIHDDPSGASFSCADTRSPTEKLTG
ncbi:hypothetical protein LTR66_005316 [Elasticomyces elasticus]|nr:hypothetical protein LTR66_005316 [Elasticomyces elasticus]